MEQDLDRFEKLLDTHSYDALSPDEKAWVAELGVSPSEYDGMREAGRELKGLSTEPIPSSPDPEILASLHRQLRLKDSLQEKPNRWAVPAWAAIAAFVMAGSAGWLIGSSTGVKEVYRDRLVTRTDTLRVFSKPDTVIVERVKYRSIPTLVPAPLVNETVAEPATKSKGVTMKEKSELEKLLVTGGL